MTKDEAIQLVLAARQGLRVPSPEEVREINRVLDLPKEIELTAPMYSELVEGPALISRTFLVVSLALHSLATVLFFALLR